jgi:threonine synthase
MDIQAASNFERFLYFLLDQDPARVRDVMARIKSGQPVVLPKPQTSLRSTRMDDAGIERVIAQMWKDWHYVIDPHTACAFTDMAEDRVSVVLATAHPAKFPDVVKKAIATEPTHPTLEALKSRALLTHPLPASTGAVKQFIARHCGQSHEA